MTSEISYAKRTPIGKFLGSLSTVPAPRLGACLVADALATTNFSKDNVDAIIMGNVLTGGVGQAPARQAAIYGGLSHHVCATTVNRVCGSGLKAVMLADQSIQTGENQLVFAGGQESMSLAPHFFDGRRGQKFGEMTVRDHMQFDGLMDPYGNQAMGCFGELCAKEYGFDRESQDTYALESYRRSRMAIAEGRFDDELVSVEVKQRKKSVKVSEDEEPSAVDLEKLPNLRPAFAADGTVTAGNASSLNDGAALVVVAKEGTVDQPIARIVGHCSYAHDPAWFTTAPVECIRKLLGQVGMGVEDIDLFEINEAFSLVPMAAIRDLKLDPQKVNVHGGAVSLGHPIGASGARILVTLIHALKQRRLRYGLASLCIGGGEASAMIVEAC